MKSSILVVNIRTGWKSEDSDPGIAWACLAFVTTQAWRGITLRNFKKREHKDILPFGQLLATGKVDVDWEDYRNKLPLLVVAKKEHAATCNSDSRCRDGEDSSRPNAAVRLYARGKGDGSGAAASVIWTLVIPL